MRLAIAALLLCSALPAVAESEFHFGGGVGWSVPLNSAVREQRQLTALSLDVSWEWERALLGITLINAPTTHVNPWPSQLTAGTPWDALMVHAAYMPWSTRLASFFIGGGMGLMFVGFRMTDEDSMGSSWFHYDSGVGGMIEAGALLFRGRRWGRVSAAAQVYVPMFSVTPMSAPGSHTVSTLVLALRAEL